MSSRTERKDRVARLLRDVWSDGDLAAVSDLIAPAYTIHHDPGDPWHGKRLDLQGYQDRVARSRAPFPDQRFEVLDLLADGDLVAVTWLWSGTHRGDLPGFPASGRAIATSGATIYYFEGSLIAGHWQITDRLSVFQQLREATAR